MRIGVVSDTHLRAGKGLPKALIDGLTGVDRILHAGDWLTLDAVDRLAAIAPVDGVAGNNDGEDIIGRFGLIKRLTLNGFRIGIVHGDEGPGKTTQERAFRKFADERPDVVLFGHSHVPFHENWEGTQLFNPGSPTDKRRQPRYSYGILELGGNGIRLRHFFYDDKSE